MAERDGWIRLHPLSPVLSAGQYVVAALAIMLQAAQDQVLGNAPGAGRVIRLSLVLLVVALGALAYTALAWRVRAYRVTDELVELKTGLVFRFHRHVPFDRIESVDTTQPLVPRLLNLAEVRIEAVSQKGSELRLRYLSVAEAERLRFELSARRRRSADSTDVALPPPDSPLLRIPLRELVLGYLVIPLVFIVPAAIIGSAIGVIASGSWLALILVLIFVGTAVVPPLLVRVERIWDFRLDDAHDALVINRGLLNLQTQRIVTGRIQAVRVEQPPLWRAFRRFRITVDVAGYRGVDGDAARAAAILLPIGSEDLVTHLLHRLELNIDLATLEFRRVPTRARWRSPLRWRSFQLAWTDTNTVIRSGVLWRRTAFVPYVKIQSARVTQGPWQRHLRLATVHLDTAGAQIAAAAAHRDAADAMDIAHQACRRAR